MSKASHAARYLVNSLSPDAFRCLVQMHENQHLNSIFDFDSRNELMRAGLCVFSYTRKLILTPRGNAKTTRAAVAERFELGDDASGEEYGGSEEMS